MCTRACTCAHTHAHTHVPRPRPFLPHCPVATVAFLLSPLSIAFCSDPSPQTLPPPTQSLSTYPIFFKIFITVCSELARYCFTCLFSVHHTLLIIPDPRKAKAWPVLLRAVAWCLEVLPGTQQRPMSIHGINEQIGLRQKKMGKNLFPFSTALTGALPTPSLPPRFPLALENPMHLKWP